MPRQEGNYVYWRSCALLMRERIFSGALMHHWRKNMCSGIGRGQTGSRRRELNKELAGEMNNRNAPPPPLATNPHEGRKLKHEEWRGLVYKGQCCHRWRPSS